MPGHHRGRRAFVGAGLLAACLPGRLRAQPGGPNRVSGSDRSSGPVRIGVLTDLAGPYADSGGPGSVLAARMAVQDFGGTVLGLPIEVLAADTRNKPDVAGGIARQWYDDGVDAITDLPVTPIAAAVQQAAREKGRTVMIAAATASELTAKSCTAVSTMWIDDNHALVSATTRAAGAKLGRNWFFITVDYTFGHTLMAEAAGLIAAAGGKVVGAALFPLGSTDFSSQVVAAQSSGADVIGLVAVGGDQVNLIKQAAEFGLGAGGRPTLAAFNVYVTDIKALGLPMAKGLTFGAGFYWDTNEATRAFSNRFHGERKAMPTKTQAAVYAACLHFLRSMQAAGTRDALAVNRAMRSLPADRFGQQATVRADGRVLYDLGLYRVKEPSQSRGEWDLYEAVGSIPAGEAFLPMTPGCGTAS